MGWLVFPEQSQVRDKQPICPNIRLNGPPDAFSEQFRQRQERK